MTRAARTPPLAFRDLDDVAAAVRRAGGRLSAPRRRVLEALFAADGPVSAAQLAAGGADGDPPLELASVYRSLEHLEELGVVRHVHLGHGPGLYALVGGGEREYLVCERCHRVTAVAPERMEPLRAQIEAAFGYRARFSHFPITGLCPSCARAEARQPPASTAS